MMEEGQERRGRQTVLCQLVHFHINLCHNGECHKQELVILVAVDVFELDGDGKLMF